MMPTCGLCHQDSELKNSHIIPEFLYKNLYNSKHQMIGINGQGIKGRKLLQKGLREKLLCGNCEHYLNENYEKPFFDSWISSFPLPDPWDLPSSEPCRIQVNYSSFKLFHLSVLFRASISSIPTFSKTSLGPHQEKIRKMVLNNHPGNLQEYPIIGDAIIRDKNKNIINLVTQATQCKLNGHRCYGMIYGGVHWAISVSSHRNREFTERSLQGDGTMPIYSIPRSEVAIIQESSHALQNPSNSR